LWWPVLQQVERGQGELLFCCAGKLRRASSVLTLRRATQVICRPCLVDTEGRKANPTEAEAAKEPHWRCKACAEYSAAFTVQFQRHRVTRDACLTLTRTSPPDRRA
jgi:hypothetical protein